MEPRGSVYGPGLEMASLISTVRTQSTPNCSQVWKCHLSVACVIGEYVGVSLTDPRGTFFQRGPVPEEIRDVFRNLVSPRQYGEGTEEGSSRRKWSEGQA